MDYVILCCLDFEALRQAAFGDLKTPDGFHFGLLDSMEKSGSC